MANYLSDRTGASIDSQLDRADTLLTPASGQELYHTGNTEDVLFGALVDGSTDALSFCPTSKYSISHSTTRTNIDSTMVRYLNGLGQAGSIVVNGTVTAYNTSSDPRLKDFALAPTDAAINTEFNKVFSCFRTFNWKSDPQGDLVWGFDAHACIDAGTDIGSEGEGSRSLNIGDVYETIPAVTENRVVMDSDGNPTTQIEEVVVTPAIDKKVTPAGVDQSKVTPILLAKIEQLERRLTAAGL